MKAKARPCLIYATGIPLSLAGYSKTRISTKKSADAGERNSQAGAEISGRMLCHGGRALGDRDGELDRIEGTNLLSFGFEKQ